MRINKKPVITAVAVTSVVALGATAAVAYWTTGGEGSGSTSLASGADAATFNVVFDDPAGSLQPGGSVDVSIGVTNNDDQTSIQITNLAAEVSTGTPGCLPEWFTFTPQSQSIGNGFPDGGQIIAPSSSIGPFGGYTLSMADLPGVDQNECKSGEVTVTITSAVAAA